MITRRSWLASAGAVCAGAQPGRSGVIVGAHTYSFRDRPVDRAIAAMQQIGLRHAEVWVGHAVPDRRPGPDAIAHLATVRQRFRDAGIEVHALAWPLRRNAPLDEIQGVMHCAHALGTTRITASTQVDQAPRIQAAAKAAGIVVGIHNQSNLRDPNELATPDTLDRVIAIYPNLALNLDIGHFTAAGFDPVDYLARRHRRVVTLHIKDWKRSQGPAMPFGEGDTPIREVLQLLRTRAWPVPAMIEYDYGGRDTVAEVRRCYDFIRNALA